MNNEELLQEIMSSSPRFKKHKHEDYAYNYCDMCPDRGRDGFNGSYRWVWWDDDMGICVQCFIDVVQEVHYSPESGSDE